MTELIDVSTEELPLSEIQSDLLIVPLTSLDDLKHAALESVAKETRIHSVAEEEGFEAKQGQLLLFRGIEALKSPRVLFVGLGKEKKEVRASLVSAARKAKTIKSRKVVVFVPEKSLTREIVEGFQFGVYSFDKYKTKKSGDSDTYAGVTDFSVVGEVCEKGLHLAQVYAKGIYFARDLGNEPPNVLFPGSLADRAVEIAEKYGFDHTVYDEKYLKENGFNLLLAVGKGDEHQPRLIHLHYKPEGEVKKSVALVGKGITFDTGGYSLKTGGHMLNMHLDMCGAAAVLGAAEIIGQLKPDNVEVHFIVPSAVNSVSSTAYKLNDIIKGLGGKTVEIQNTDAEGRLVLADALAYAQQQSPDEIIDLATLTGACVVALGETTAALYSTDEKMASKLLDAAKSNDEDLWRMPLTQKLDKSLDSKVADMRNIGERMGGSITAALFLKRWIEIDSWSHIDLAGPAMVSSPSDLSSAGGTGYAVALLASYLTEQ